MAVIETWLKTDLKSIVKVNMFHGILFSQDNMANLIGVELLDGGEPATVTGSVSANVLRADGTTVAVAGTLSGNKASVTLPQAAYAVPGMLAIVIKLTDSSTVTTIGAIQSIVYRASTDTIIDPGTIIPSVQDLIAAIEEAVESIPPDYSELTGEVSDLKSAFVSVKDLSQQQKTFDQGTAYGNVGGNLNQSSNNTRCRIWKDTMAGFTIVSNTGYDFYVYFTNNSGIIQAKTDNWVTKYVVPNDNVYGVTVVARKTADTDITPSEAKQNILFSQAIIEKITGMESADAALKNRMFGVDGQIEIDPDDYEIGAISISTSGWSRVSSAKRVSTKIEKPVSLHAGDIISLSDYSTANFYIGYKRTNNTYDTPGAWLAQDYVCPEDASYVITIKNVPTEITLNSKSELLDMLSITDKNSVILKVNNLMTGFYSVPGNFTATEVYSETYDTMKAVQGLCSDGTYLYQAVMEQLGNEGAGTTIKKIQVSDMTLVDSETGIFGHCNDMCYDPTDGYILAVYKDSTNYNVVTRFSANTLGKIDDIDLSSLAASIGTELTFIGISYAADIDRFILAVQTGYSLVGFAFVKRDWTLEKYIKVIPQSNVIQCIDYNNGIIYAGIHMGGAAERIFAYDLHGNVINYTENTFGFEGEGIAIVGDTFYLSYNQSNYQVLHLFTATPSFVGVSIAQTMAKYNLN